MVDATQKKELAETIWQKFQAAKPKPFASVLDAIPKRMATEAHGGLIGHAVPFVKSNVKFYIQLKSQEDALKLVEALEDYSYGKIFQSRANFVGLSCFLDELGIENPFVAVSLSLSEQMALVFEANEAALGQPSDTANQANWASVSTAQNKLKNYFIKTGRIDAWPKILADVIKETQPDAKSSGNFSRLGAYERLLHFAMSTLERTYTHLDKETAQDIQGTSWETHWKEQLGKRDKPYPSL